LLSNRAIVTDVEITSTAGSGRRNPLFRVAVVAGSVVTASASVLLPSAWPSGAAPLGSARAQAAQIGSQLQADQARLDALDQQYELAEEQLSGIQDQIAQVSATISQDENMVAADQVDLRAEALANYESGESDSGLQGVFGDSDEQAAATEEYDSLAAGDMSTAVDDLRLAQVQLDDKQAQLESAESQAQSVAGQIATERNAAQATADEEQATLNSVNSQIAELLAEQQAASHAAYLGELRDGLANPPPNGAAGVAVRAAESQIGVPYQWGAEDPGHGFDCSGLTQWSWGQAGVSIPRTANDQYDAVARVPLADMEPGDLVFWGSGGYAEHVGMYVGNGDVVDAPSTGQDVQIQPIWSDGLLGAGRT